MAECFSGHAEVSKLVKTADQALECAGQLSREFNGGDALTRSASKPRPNDLSTITAPDGSLKLGDSIYGSAQSYKTPDEILTPEAAIRLGNSLDLDYKAAMKGDIEEQEFIKRQVKEWKELPAQSPMRDYVNMAIDQLGYIDPAAAALFRKGIATGDVDFKN